MRIKDKRTKSQKKIDEIAVKAKRAGMSYGQYVALTEYYDYYPVIYIADQKKKSNEKIMK